MQALTPLALVALLSSARGDALISRTRGGDSPLSNARGDSLLYGTLSFAPQCQATRITFSTPTWTRTATALAGRFAVRAPQSSVITVSGLAVCAHSSPKLFSVTGRPTPAQLSREPGAREWLVVVPRVHDIPAIPPRARDFCPWACFPALRNGTAAAAPRTSTATPGCPIDERVAYLAIAAMTAAAVGAIATIVQRVRAVRARLAAHKLAQAEDVLVRVVPVPRLRSASPPVHAVSALLATPLPAKLATPGTLSASTLKTTSPLGTSSVARRVSFDAAALGSTYKVGSVRIEVAASRSGVERLQAALEAALAGSAAGPCRGGYCVTAVAVARAASPPP